MKALSPEVHASDHADEAHAPKSASQKARELASMINKLMVAAALLLGGAFIYGVCSASTPSYFH